MFSATSSRTLYAVNVDDKQAQVTVSNFAAERLHNSFCFYRFEERTRLQPPGAANIEILKCSADMGASDGEGESHDAVDDLPSFSVDPGGDLEDFIYFPVSGFALCHPLTSLLRRLRLTLSVISSIYIAMIRSMIIRDCRYS